MSRSVRVPGDLFDSRRFGFAQVTIVSTPFGDEVHVAGQTAWDADRNLIGKGDISRQLEKCLENVATALASAGASLDQVGSLRIYIKQSHLREGQAIGRTLREVFGDKPPCSTWIGVTGLAHEDFLVEVEPSPVLLARERK